MTINTAFLIIRENCIGVKILYAMLGWVVYNAKGPVIPKTFKKREFRRKWLGIVVVVIFEEDNFLGNYFK